MRNLIFFLLASSLLVSCEKNASPPRVFIYTDININAGDPDDRQSLVHLLWYADELQIEGIVPDRWNARGLEACHLALDAYARDYETYDFGSGGYPDPATLEQLLAHDTNDATRRLHEASLNGPGPLYVLVWGNMINLGKALKKYPDMANRIRVITIGTGLKYGPKDEVPGEDCKTPNWNGPGRNDIYNDPRFRKMWWLEINWTYNGMFSGEGPKQMFEKLSGYGAMGQQLKDVTESYPWARYFRVGDTPSVLYLVDPDHDPDDPASPSWAGKFKKPFPGERPHYFTDDNGPVAWNFADPCKTWNNREEMYAYNKSTLEHERDEMYAALLNKLARIYGNGDK